NRVPVHVDSRLHCSEDRHLLWLGGQYGEESQIEDEVRGEEDCEEDQAQNHAQKGEVASAASTRSACKLPRVASHLSAGSHASMRNAAAGPADKVATNGVGGIQFGLHEFVVGGRR